IFSEGLVIAGKKINVRRIDQEPRRCLNCQKLDANHNAAQCPGPVACGYCAKDHRTETCQGPRQNKIKCANCQVEGHSARDRACP
ncbi:hypothetical protein SISNIDRAFT_396131, partial [Sistotremastrum niveocremeum HHB9708]